MPGHVSARKICHEYFQKCPLHRSLQESKRSIGHEKFTATGVSHSMASFTRHVSTFDRTSVWMHGLGSTSWKLRRSKDSQSPFKGWRMYAMSQIHRDTMMSSSQDSITTVSLMNRSKKSAQLLIKDLLYRLDGLFAFYHRQWRCHRQMFCRFKWCHGCLNALALIIVAPGIVVGSVLENSLLISCLTAAGTVIKGWNDFKKFSFKIDMCRFAYTTYDKTLIELRTYVGGLPMEEFEGCLIKMQTLDDTITDFTPPVSDKCVQEYEQRFRYDNVDKSGSTLVWGVVCAMKSKRAVRRKLRRRRKTQKGGLFPLAALIPA